jgi:pyruvate/2-oxoglutarate dehydrogenase complex dihydrolipoamide acyltransferase (E2) component
MTLKLPKMAVSMQEGTLVEWLVKSGDQVAMGQPLYVIETEKTASEVPSPFTGEITTLVKVGESYKVGTPIAEIVT